VGGILFAAFWMPAGMWIYRQKVRTMKQIEAVEMIEGAGNGNLKSK
jgi:hypothetical protein